MYLESFQQGPMKMFLSQTHFNDTEHSRQDRDSNSKRTHIWIFSSFPINSFSYTCMLGSPFTASMLHLFLGLKSLVKVRRFHTDGSVFRLHYKITTMILLAFTFIVTTRQYVGAPIMCVHSRDVPKEVLNTYCWIHPTYTLSSAHWKRVGIDVPHPGVDKTRDAKDKKHVKYYQWVGFLLFLQVGSNHLGNCVHNDALLIGCTKSPLRYL